VSLVLSTLYAKGKPNIKLLSVAVHVPKIFIILFFYYKGEKSNNKKRGGGGGGKRWAIRGSIRACAAACLKFDPLSRLFYESECFTDERLTASNRHGNRWLEIRILFFLSHVLARS